MKNKFLSKAYGGVTVARRKLYGLGLPRQWKVITSTLLLLFTFAIGNVWGAVLWESDMQETITGVTQTKNKVTYDNSLSFAWAADYTKGLHFTGSSAYVNLAYSSAIELEAGDVIRFYVGCSGTSARTLSLYLNNGSSAVATQSVVGSVLTTLEYKLTADLTLNSVKVTGNGADAYLFKMCIYRDAPATGETTISCAFTYKGSNVKGWTNNCITTISGFSTSLSLVGGFATSGNNGLAGCSGEITGQPTTKPDDWDKTKYADIQFTIADGYTFTPTATSFKWSSNNSAYEAKIAIIDENNEIESNVSSSTGTQGKMDAFGFASSAFTDKKLSGTVHIRIYMRGANKRAWLSSPFTITGTVASAAPAATYDATFANGGHGSAPAKAEGVSSVTLTELTESGWLHTGWKADKATKNGTTDVAANTLIENGETITLLENTTFTAQWAKLYTVTYNKAAGEEGDVPTQDPLVDGSTFDVAGSGSLYPPTPGQVFRGWDDGIAAEPYKAGDEYTIAGENVNFTAVWGATTSYTITLDAKGGSVASYDSWTKDGDVYSKTVVEGTTVPLLAFTKADVQLMFFRDGSANEYSGSVTLNSDMNLSAVWGEEKEVTIYSWESPSGTAIEEGGVASYYTDPTTKDGSNERVNYANTAQGTTYYTICLNGKADWSTNQIKIALDQNIEAGDEIKMTAYFNTDNTSKKASAQMYTEAGAKIFDGENLPNIYSEGSPVEQTYTALAGGTKDIKMTRLQTGSNTFITKLVITGTRVVEVKDPCETPTITAQPAGGTYNWNQDPSMSVTASVTDGGTLKYQWYKKGTPDAKVGTNSNAFTPTESGTYYVIVTNTKAGYGDADKKSDEVAVTINARPSYTVTYYDGASKLGEEDVLEAANPADYEDYQAKAIYGISGLYTFNGWFNNSDLAEEHKIADVAALAIGVATNIYGKWTKKYAENVDIAAYAAENVDDDSSNDAEELAAFKTWFTGKGYVHANLNGLDKTTSNNGAYAGIKTKSNTAYYAFNVVANKRVTIKLGYMAGAAEMYINGVKNTTQALTGGSISSGDNYADWYYDVTEESTLQLKIVNGGTCVLKAVTIGEIPAVSDDATLSDLTLKYGEEEAATITGFVSSKYIYNVVMPYGTTKAELPIVGATATQGAKSLVTINQAKDRDDWKTVIRVQAEDRVDEHDKYYEVRFIVEPKQGVSLIKATTQKVVTGYIGGTAVLTKDGSAQSGNTYKLDSKVTFGITLADGKKFKEGDVFVMNITTAPGSATSMGTMKVYDAADATEPIYETAEVGSVGVNYWTLPAAAEGKTSLYIKRGNGDDWNPTFSYVEVQRLMAPVIKSFKIGEAEGVINESAKTIAVEVPYGTAVNALTPEIEYYGNGIGAIDKTGPQDFTNPVEYTVSSAYAEDATGDYAPVTYTVTVNVAAHYEAKIGETRYSTVTAAFAEVANGETIELMDNCSYADTWVIDGKNVTLDLHGFNLTYTSNQGAADVKNGKLTIKDVTATVAPVVDMTANPLNEAAVTYTSGKFDCGAGVGIYSLAGGEVVVESGRLEAQECVVLVLDNGKVTVNNGVLVAKDNGVLMGNGTAGRGGYTITVNDGVLIGKIQSAGYASMVIYHPNVGTLNISGGTLISTNGPAVVVRAGESHIDGGTIVAQGSGTGKCGDATLVLPAVGVAYDFKSAYPGGNINAEITGGDVTGAAGAVTAIYAATEPTPAEEAAVNISGGAFSSVVAEALCAEGYIPVTTPNAQGKYEVIAAGIIRGAAVQDANDVYYYTLDNGVTIYSSQSDGRLNTSNHISNSSSDVTNCGGDNVGHNVNQSKFLLKFPVNVKEFTLYAANNTARTFNNIYVNDEASADIKISTVGDELTGTYTYTKDGKCQTMTAVFDDANIIPANYYVLVTLSGTANIYRVLYTEAECTTPTVTVADQTAKDGVAVNLIAEASALGATYQWYTCEDELGTNPVSIPGGTAKTLSVTKSGADDQFYKVVVGCNCSEETAAAVAKVSLYTAVTTLVDVTENTIWDWTVVTKDIDGQDITSDGKKVNGANGILANYIQGTNMDKIESNNGAYAIRSNSNQYYQGASLHMHTTKAGMLKLHVRSDGNAMTLNVQNAGRDIELGSLGNWKDYTIYVQAGDVTVYNVPETAGKPMRVEKMTFTVKESPDYTRDQMLGAGVYGTICVPYNVPAGGIHGITVYELMGRESQYGKLAFDEIIEMEAGVPYVFQAHGDELALFYGETSVAAPVDKGNGMYGTFTSITLTDLNDVYYFAQKALWGCADLTSLKVPANRAYVKLSEVGSADPNPAPGRRRISMAVNGEQIATGIENTGFESEAPRKVLINGELFIIRGEKMYDAKGQLVK